MALRDAKRLFDVSLRLQIFAEGVKAFQAREFDKLITDVSVEFQKLLLRIKFDTLDSLTKSELNKLVVTLRKSQSHVYSIYLKKLLKQLEQFMEASLSLNRRILVSDFLYLEEGAQDEAPTDEEASNFIAAGYDANKFIAVNGIASILLGGGPSLWGKIKAEPMGANGVLLEPYLKAMLGSAQVGFENTLTKGYANAWTVREAVEAGEKQASKAKFQGASALATSMQNIASMVSASVASGLFGKYRWLSVIDSGTTDICYGRNQRVYEYGKGPLPPAHTGCRSHTVPYVAGDLEKETFFSWIKRQPNSIQNIALGARDADALRDGSLLAKNVRLNVKPISIEDYEGSVNKILFA